MNGWAAQQLTEYLVQLGECEDVPSALRSGLDRAAEAFEAEAGVVVRGGEVCASIGFAAPAPDWGIDRAPVPGIGDLPFVNAPFDGGRMALAREDEPFSVQEAALLRGMAQALAQTVHNLELVHSLRVRQGLLERLAQIQRSIVERTDLDSLLEAIVNGARELVGGDVITLRLLDDGVLRLAASSGVDDATRERLAGRALVGPLPTELSVHEDPSHPFLKPRGCRA